MTAIDNSPDDAMRPEAAATVANRLTCVPESQEITSCEQQLGYTFQDKSLLSLALTHASGADHRLASNERLEFLGDAILGSVVCQRLYQKYPESLEGDLTTIKSAVVSRQTCAKVSQNLGLEKFLVIGKGMTNSESVPLSLLAGLFESLVAAIYLDGGEKSARCFIERYLDPEIELVASGESGENYKSSLQQLAQRDFGSTPVYQLLDEKGPDHAKCFKVAAVVSDKAFAPAWGRNKKEAEQHAACNALAQVENNPIPHPSE
ncbi:MAG: ribonuclease III [Pirellulaceae bacterium]